MNARTQSFPSRAIAAVALACALILGGTTLRATPAQSGSRQRLPYTTEFRLADCTFASSGSANPYFILDPGRTLVLAGEEGKEAVEVRITVLNATEDITVPEIGTVRTRVVEEREWADGELTEVSRNFFAICKETSDVVYFGEDVDDYAGGVIVGHGGAWRAGVNGARPGLIMPGRFLLGARYYQEIAPGIALDRAEHAGMELTIETPADTFEHCVTVLESSDLSSGTSFKAYAPGVGLVVDQTLALVSWTP